MLVRPAGDASISTLPATARQVGAALASAPASLLMGKLGRRYGFMTGGLLGVAGGLIAALALQLRSFPLLCFGTMLIGAEAGFGGYARYAAVEIVPPRQQPRAISLTVSGSVVRLATRRDGRLARSFSAASDRALCGGSAGLGVGRATDGAVQQRHARYRVRGDVSTGVIGGSAVHMPHSRQYR